jgi:hypothetical protein
MRAFDPDSRNHHDERWEFVTSDHILRPLAVIAGCLFLASLVPPGLVALVLRDLLGAAALGLLVAALFRGQALFAPVFTLWDEAAVLCALSLLVGLVVDPAAADAAMEQWAAANGTTGS